MFASFGYIATSSIQMPHGQAWFYFVKYVSFELENETKKMFNLYTSKTLQTSYTYNRIQIVQYYIFIKKFTSEVFKILEF